jgi:hypothetical protein
MRLFRRDTGSAGAFWRERPPSGVAEVLYQQGIRCVMNDDGAGMMRVGWALWQRGGERQAQAVQFLRDGYRLWAQRPDTPADLEVQFLRDLFGMATVEASSVAGAELLAWSAPQLLERMESRGDSTTLIDQQRQVFTALAGLPREFLPPRAVATMRRLATGLGEADPFG